MTIKQIKSVIKGNGKNFQFKNYLTSEASYIEGCQLFLSRWQAVHSAQRPIPQGYQCIVPSFLSFDQLLISAWNIKAVTHQVLSLSTRSTVNI